MKVRVIGAGLAGSEAAYQLANRNIEVELYEQKPVKRHYAFKTDDYAELICSNSLRSDDKENAVGLLKEEMRILDSLIMKMADKNRVPAGKSLAVDRVAFSKDITDVINAHPNIKVIHEEVTQIDPSVPTIICAGPLCEGKLAESLSMLCGNDFLHFYDAIAPIVEKDSIDFDHAYYKSRYGDDDSGDYINCPLTKEEYDLFYEKLISAPCAPLHDPEEEKYFEGCMPFEAMAKRGYKTLLFGPMKPVGLEYEGKRSYAVVQLRKDNAIDTLYNIVGFQTHLTFPAQKEVLQTIPALHAVSIVRYGVMHRNTYVNSPNVINEHYQFIRYPNVFIAGQISGVEGYVESAASGLYAALNLAQYLDGSIRYDLGPDTMMGAMAAYISDPNIRTLQPMNANFGIFKCPYDGDKAHKKAYFVSHALDKVREYADHVSLSR
ncbi:MAG: methylenetetrahydrofolate--tRNA-(uracil(54)-C(5))-methyltransferase (FADH(2)-oxidizing) TrmFO [Erysipelotrichaceae bacterium]|nr:methylenetetrahydrofolate--tRNA-(uracil(54)-C(5))-methyltransferase (FADH(2)-oxidizing) TrmFO [Erysipelotrichaceae bacterium]